MMDIGWFEVKCKIEQNMLYAEILEEYADASNAFVEYYFYLIKDGKTIDKKGWMKKNTYKWELSESGMYCVQGYVRRGEKKVFRRSSAMGYFDCISQQKFKDFLQNDMFEALPYEETLRFFPAKKPFADFLIVTQKKRLITRYKISKFIEENSEFKQISHSIIGDFDACVLGTGGALKLPDGNTLCFSGTTIYNNKLVFGIQDIPNNVECEKLISAYGNNNVIIIQPDEIRIGTDFFNFSRWFYFEYKDLFVISNRYHALLRLLKSLNIPLKLDEQKAAITLSTVSIQFLMQNFTRMMDVRGVFQLENDKTLRFNDTGWNKEENQYGAILRYQKDLQEQEYKDLLKKAKDEIITQVKQVLYDNRFDHVKIDLTGGLDSRLIYAAATNCDRQIVKEKVRIVSNPVVGSNDLSIATRINGIYGIDYDNLPQILQTLKISEADQMMRSFYLGTYFSFNPHTSIVKENKDISLNGACGEILARPYMARKYFGSLIDGSKSSKKVAIYLWGDFSANIVAADLDTAHDFEKYLCEELEKLPVKDLLEAYDRIYLQFRHAYHFDQLLQYATGRVIWMPMQSKTAFILHHLTFTKFKSIRLQLDLIAELNPLLLSIEFDSQLDNQDYDKLANDLAIEDERFLCISTEGKKDILRWEAARQQQNANRKYIYACSSEREQLNEEYQKRSELLYRALLRNFRILMLDCSELRERIGVALYYYITNQKDNPKNIQYMYNKVTSLVDQLKIVNE